jgi:hypothetical protein
MGKYKSFFFSIPEKQTKIANPPTELCSTKKMTKQKDNKFINK